MEDLKVITNIDKKIDFSSENTHGVSKKFNLLGLGDCGVSIMNTNSCDLNYRNIVGVQLEHMTSITASPETNYITNLEINSKSLTSDGNTFDSNTNCVIGDNKLKSFFTQHHYELSKYITKTGMVNFICLDLCDDFAVDAAPYVISLMSYELSKGVRNKNVVSIATLPAKTAPQDKQVNAITALNALKELCFSVIVVNADLDSQNDELNKALPTLLSYLQNESGYFIGAETDDFIANLTFNDTGLTAIVSSSTKGHDSASDAIASCFKSPILSKVNREHIDDYMIIVKFNPGFNDDELHDVRPHQTSYNNLPSNISNRLIDRYNTICENIIKGGSFDEESIVRIGACLDTSMPQDQFEITMLVSGVKLDEIY